MSEQEGAQPVPAESVQAKPAAKPAPKERAYQVSFAQNRSFELCLEGQVVYRFEPYGVWVTTAEVVNHPDFAQVRQWFNVQEVTE